MWYVMLVAQLPSYAGTKWYVMLVAKAGLPCKHPQKHAATYLCHCKVLGMLRKVADSARLYASCKLCKTPSDMGMPEHEWGDICELHRAALDSCCSVILEPFSLFRSPLPPLLDGRNSRLVSCNDANVPYIPLGKERAAFA